MSIDFDLIVRDVRTYLTTITLYVQQKASNHVTQSNYVNDALTMHAEVIIIDFTHYSCMLTYGVDILLYFSTIASDDCYNCCAQVEVQLLITCWN